MPSEALFYWRLCRVSMREYNRVERAMPLAAGADRGLATNEPGFQRARGHRRREMRKPCQNAGRLTPPPPPRGSRPVSGQLPLLPSFWSKCNPRPRLCVYPGHPAAPIQLAS